MELDHFFILTGPGAPQAALLSALGMVEGTPNHHAGQGTANRRFFFTDAMLELLYLHDPKEAMNGPGSRLRLGERLSNERASPFGLVLRMAPGQDKPPFPGWRYCPDYADPARPLLIGENSEVLEEPLCVAAALDAARNGADTRSPDPFCSVSELRVSIPVSRPSAVLRTIAGTDRIRLRLGMPHLMEVEFQQARQGQRTDLRPALPLVISW
jgi:hypothetical protein